MRVIIPAELTLVSSDVAASALAEYASGTSYAAGDQVVVSFESDGTTALTPVRIYESASASNLGNYPPDNPADWLLVGSTNRWAMFDDVVGTSTTASAAINVTVSASKADRVALFGLVAESVTITVRSGGSTISSETLDLIRSSSASWSEYFFSDRDYAGSIVYSIPGYYLSFELDIEITPLSGSAACGHCIVGKSIDIGLTRYGAASGVRDYSLIQDNNFGETTIVRRPYANTLSLDVWLDRDRATYIKNKLASLRATPVVWDARNDSDGDEHLIVYGIYRDFSFVVEYPTINLYSLNIRGLI